MVKADIYESTFEFYELCLNDHTFQKAHLKATLVQGGGLEIMYNLIAHLVNAELMAT